MHSVHHNVEGQVIRTPTLAKQKYMFALVTYYILLNDFTMRQGTFSLQFSKMEQNYNNFKLIQLRGEISSAAIYIYIYTHTCARTLLIQLKKIQEFDNIG